MPSSRRRGGCKGRSLGLGLVCVLGLMSPSSEHTLRGGSPGLWRWWERRHEQARCSPRGFARGRATWTGARGAHRVAGGQGGQGGQGGASKDRGGTGGSEYGGRKVSPLGGKQGTAQVWGQARSTFPASAHWERRRKSVEAALCKKIPSEPAASAHGGWAGTLAAVGEHCMYYTKTFHT